MGHDAVYHAGKGFGVLALFRICFFQCARNEAVFGIGDGLFAILVHHLADAFGFLVAYLDDFRTIGQGGNHVLLDVFIVL